MRKYFCIAALSITAPFTAPAATYDLKATPENVVIGSYWSEAKPVLRVQSGDTVVIHTVSQSIGMATKEQIGPEYEAIRNAQKDRGPGGHFLTGPVYVEGAEPGDVLEVRIQKIDLDIDYAQNNFGPTSGFLPEDFPYRKGKLIKLDRQRKVAEFAPGIEIPATVRVSARTFAEIGAGIEQIESALPDGGFPIIARPVDSHGGKGLEKLETTAEVENYLARNVVPEYYLSRFVEYRSPDGCYRKYRIAVIDGVPFASHLAISDHWMIHFLNAGMGESAEKRREEADFMDRFECEFAARHGRAFAEMATLSGLEYFGVDCGETPDGKLLLFEADTSLIVHNMDSPVEFPYKARHMRSLFEAFRAMLTRKAKNRN